MFNGTIRSAKKKFKSAYRQLLQPYWNTITFDECREKVTGKYELYPQRDFEFVHRLAVPETVYYHRDKINIYIVNNVFVWPHYSVIQSSRDTVISDSAFSKFRLNYLVNNRLLRKYRIIRESQPCAVIEQAHWNNYYHWHIDTLPRLYALQHPEIQKLPRIKLFLTEKLSETGMKIITSLLPENTQIEFVPSGSRIYAENYLHLPYLSSEWAGYLPDDYIEFYRERIFSAFRIPKYTDDINEKIYISRRNAESRRILNEDSLYAVLQDFGFKHYELESIPIEEQMRLFHSAKFIIGQHGAGLTNMIYARNAKVLEIFSSNYPGVNHYRILAGVMGHEYVNMFSGKKIREDELQTPWKISYTLDLINADVEIPIDDFQRYLKIIDSE